MIEASRFWRDPALPFVEARRVGDGRQVCYAAHSHESFSLGVITGGRSSYMTGAVSHEVTAGSTVLIKPSVVHSCNPVAGEAWSYLMLFVDMPWLSAQGVQLPEATRAIPQRCTAGYCSCSRTCSMKRRPSAKPCSQLFRDLPAICNLRQRRPVMSMRNWKLAQRSSARTGRTR